MTITFGTLAVNKPAAKKKAADRPVLNEADPEVEKIATEIYRLNEEVGMLDLLKKELASRARTFGFKHFAGKQLTAKDSLSIAALTEDGHEVLVSLVSRYSQMSDKPEVERLMGEAFTRYMREAFEVKVDGNKLPVTPIPEEILPGVSWPDPSEVGLPTAQVIINRIAAIMQEFGCTEAVSVKQYQTPAEAFHRERYTAFDTETNEAIDKLMPMVVSVKPVTTK